MITVSVVLATVGDPPTTGIEPLFTRIAPAALRLITIAFAAPSPTTVSTPEANVAVVAACADVPTPPTAQAPTTVPASSRVATRRHPPSRPAFIVAPTATNRPAIGPMVVLHV